MEARREEREAEKKIKMENRMAECEAEGGEEKKEAEKRQRVAERMAEFGKRLCVAPEEQIRRTEEI